MVKKIGGASLAQDRERIEAVLRLLGPGQKLAVDANGRFEVEDAIFSHPWVVEAAVIGIPDAKWGEAIKAVVTLRQAAVVSEREIIDHCRRRIAGLRCPKSVDFVL